MYNILHEQVEKDNQLYNQNYNKQGSIGSKINILKLALEVKELAPILNCCSKPHQKQKKKKKKKTDSDIKAQFANIYIF